MPTDSPFTALLYDPALACWRGFATPREIITAQHASEVVQALQEIERRTEEDGLHAAGFISYEAAPAFDPALETHGDNAFPLVWFGLFDAPETVMLPRCANDTPIDWRCSLDADRFGAAVNAIKAAIARGETYQVNLTFPYSAPFAHDPWPFFLQLVHNQSAGHAAWIDTGRYAICSASPELFFSLDGTRLISRPMKGTAPRGMTQKEDLLNAEILHRSEKDRAENVMILDMIRNDLGRLPGGPVRTVESFRIEKYPTLWQMTSTAETTTDAPVSEIFRALFPCASITGAPKVQTMKLIRRLEPVPRGIYTGAIGHLSPGRRASFSVAIRTALVDRERGTAAYGVGAGITWDSAPDAEYRECLLKARILSAAKPDFELLETLLWSPGEGYALFEEHLLRLGESAAYFDFAYTPEALRTQLERCASGLADTPHKVRLLLSCTGESCCEAVPLESSPDSTPLRVALADTPVDSHDPFLYHKTTHRRVYEQARASHTGVDEVLLWNERGELTEACNYNLVVEREGEKLTPPVNSGLLAGTLRKRLVETGDVREVVLHKDELDSFEAVWLINSVRGWKEAIVVCRD